MPDPIPGRGIVLVSMDELMCLVEPMKTGVATVLLVDKVHLKELKRVTSPDPITMLLPRVTPPVNGIHPRVVSQ